MNNEDKDKMIKGLNDFVSLVNELKSSSYNITFRALEENALNLRDVLRRAEDKAIKDTLDGMRLFALGAMLSNEDRDIGAIYKKLHDNIVDIQLLCTNDSDEEAST